MTEATDPVRGTGSPLAALGVGVVAVLLGLLCGLLVSADALLGEVHPVKALDLHRWMPFPASFAVLTAFAIGLVLFALRDWTFERRFSLAVLLLLVAGALSGVNAGPIDATDVVLIVIGPFWLFSSMIERRPVHTPGAILVLGTGLVALALASSVNVGFGGLLSQRSIINKFLVLLVISNLSCDTASYRRTGKAFLVIATLSALLAIGTEVVYLTTGVLLTAEDLGQYHLKETPFGLMYRATSLMPTTQTHAHMLILGLSLTLLVPLRPLKRLAVILTLATAIAFTFSAGAYLTTAAVFIAWPFLRRPERALPYAVLLLLLLATAVVTGAAGWVQESLIEPLGGKGVEDRVGYLQAGIRALERDPIFGLGFRDIGRVLYTPVHNAYVQFAVECGVLAGLFFTALVGYVTVRSGSAAWQATDPGDRAWAMALFLGMLALALHLFVEPFYDNYTSWAYMGLVAGMIAAHERRRRMAVAALRRSEGPTGVLQVDRQGFEA